MNSIETIAYGQLIDHVSVCVWVWVSLAWLLCVCCLCAFARDKMKFHKNQFRQGHSHLFKSFFFRSFPCSVCFDAPILYAQSTTQTKEEEEKKLSICTNTSRFIYRMKRYALIHRVSLHWKTWFFDWKRAYRLLYCSQIVQIACVCVRLHTEKRGILNCNAVFIVRTLFTHTFFLFAFVLLDRRVAISHLNTKSMHVHHFKSMFERSCHNTILFTIRNSHRCQYVCGKSSNEECERAIEWVSKRIRTKSTMSLEDSVSDCWEEVVGRDITQFYCWFYFLLHFKMNSHSHDAFFMYGLMLRSVGGWIWFITAN